MMARSAFGTWRAMSASTSGGAMQPTSSSRVSTIWSGRLRERFVASPTAQSASASKPFMSHAPRP